LSTTPADTFHTLCALSTSWEADEVITLPLAEVLAPEELEELLDELELVTPLELEELLDADGSLPPELLEELEVIVITPLELEELEVVVPEELPEPLDELPVAALTASMTSIEKAGSAVVVAPSLALMTMSAYSPGTLGVPESCPVVSLNVAQTGLFWMPKVRGMAVGLTTVG
jgi:hypothetical protein